MKNYCFIINPISGIGRQKVLEGLLTKAFFHSRKSYSIRYTEHAGHATELANECAGNGTDVVVAVGGDGSLNEVAKALTGSSLAMGIIPAGSGNGFARHIGMPMNTERALMSILSGRKAGIDTAKLNGHPFFVTAGTGYDAQIAHRFADGRKRGLRSYVKIAVQEFFKYTSKTYSITIGDTTEKREAFIICVANANQWGSNAFIAPNARLDDGLLDLCILNDFGVAAAAGVVKDLLSSNLENNKFYRTGRIKSLTIDSEEPVAWHVDGEPLPYCKQANISVQPNSLTIIRPHE